MDYTVAEVKEKLNQFSDKNGSDYFTLPVLLNYFHTATYDFVGERLDIVEKTQKITDDIRNIVVPLKLTVIADPNDATRYITAIPANYLRVLSYDVLYADGTRCRRADAMRQAEYTTAVLNPNKKPTKHYPIILQENNLFQIDSGDDVPAFMKITYAKKPSFAKTSQLNRRIVNLPDSSIEQILLMTVTRLFGSTGDERTQSNYQLQESFRQILK